MQSLGERPEHDPLIKRADALLAETAKLLEAHRTFRVEVKQQVERMRQIGAQLDPLLPHPPSELAVVRALLTEEALTGN
jgi:uncharacterized membrane protein YccC